ncbi:MAG: flavin reductase family protein [Micropruina sp.]|nr:flavin reductase family protein [Micropruina sp.]
MTIHSSHPFEAPQSGRNPLRRFRGRLAAPVTAWTSLDARQLPVGLTVSSVLVADGTPGEVIGLINPDSAFFDALVPGARFVVNLLGWQHRQLADALADLGRHPAGCSAAGRGRSRTGGRCWRTGRAGWPRRSPGSRPRPGG